MDRMLTFFGVERGKDKPSADVFPLGMAPFIRLSREGQEGGNPALVAEDGMFGLLPAWAEMTSGSGWGRSMPRLPALRGYC
jgi:hypothetical protein